MIGSRICNWKMAIIAGILSHDCTATEYINGLQYDFIPFKALYALIKTVLFAFIIASVSSFYGFYIFLMR